MYVCIFFFCHAPSRVSLEPSGCYVIDKVMACAYTKERLRIRLVIGQIIIDNVGQWLTVQGIGRYGALAKYFLPPTCLLQFGSALWELIYLLLNTMLNQGNKRKWYVTIRRKSECRGEPKYIVFNASCPQGCSSVVCFLIGDALVEAREVEARSVVG